MILPPTSFTSIQVSPVAVKMMTLSAGGGVAAVFAGVIGVMVSVGLLTLGVDSAGVTLSVVSEGVSVAGFELTGLAFAEFALTGLTTPVVASLALPAGVEGTLTGLPIEIPTLLAGFDVVLVVVLAVERALKSGSSMSTIAAKSSANTPITTGRFKFDSAEGAGPSARVRNATFTPLLA